MSGKSAVISSIEDRVELNNGVKMPWFGLGVFLLNDDVVTEDVVRTAIDLGYRSIDTASIYKNERGVGNAIRDCEVPREELFITTKVWNDDQRSGRVLEAFEESLERLRVDYVDLYLVHWPVAGRYVDTWKKMEEIYDSGRAKAIGVSNFMPQHLDDLAQSWRIVPTVNQVEFHPRLLQPELLKKCRDYDIVPEAWSPLMQGQGLDHPVILAIAEKHRKTSAQVILRWDLQHEVITIPKSAHAERIEENAAIFDFELDDDDMRQLDAMDEGHRFGPDPNNFDF